MQKAKRLCVYMAGVPRWLRKQNKIKKRIEKMKVTTEINKGKISSFIDLLDAVKNRVCDRCGSSFIIPHAYLGGHYQCQKCNRVGRADDFPHKDQGK